MNVFKQFIRKTFSYMKDVYRTNPYSTIATFVATLFGTMWVLEWTDVVRDIDYYDSFMMAGFVASVLWALACFCYESFERGYSKAVSGIIVSAAAAVSVLVALASVYCELWEKPFRFITDARGDTGVSLMTVAYGAILLLIALYNYCRSSYEKNLAQVSIKAFSKMFFVGIVAGVMSWGVIILVLIVSALLYDDASEYIPAFLVIITGIFWALNLIKALTFRNEKENKFIEVLVKYVMLIMSLMAYVIIYLYIIKILLTGEYPSNSVYGILTALFISTMLISYMCTSYEKKGLLQKLAYYMPLIFVPFIVLQIYSIGSRILQYGLTPNRYIGVAFIVLEIVYITYYSVQLFKKKSPEMSKILLVVAAMAAVVFLIPGVNCISLSRSVCSRTVRRYFETKNSASGSEYSGKALSRLAGAYEFLHDDDYGRVIFSDILNSDEENEIRLLIKGSTDVDNIRVDNERTLWCFMSTRSIDISDYRQMIKCRLDGDNSGGDDAYELRVYIDDYQIDESNADEYLEGRIEKTYRAKNYIDSAVAVHKEFINNQIYETEMQNELDKMRIIKFDEDSAFVVEHVEIRYNQFSGEVMDVELEGILLY